MAAIYLFWRLGVRGVGFVNGGASSKVGLSQAVRGTVNHKLMHVTDWFPTDFPAKGR